MFRKCIILKKVFQNFHYLLNCNSIFRLLGEEGEQEFPILFRYIKS